MAWLTYSSGYQWARRGFVPVAGCRSHKRGSIGQPLFSERQVVYVGAQRALNAYQQFQNGRKAVESREPNDGLIWMNGGWYRRV